MERFELMHYSAIMHKRLKSPDSFFAAGPAGEARDRQKISPFPPPC
jgi:hypothetical protein